MQQPGASQRTRLILAAAWAGSAILMALTATVLNQTMIDRVAFGQTVSGLFRLQASIGLVCGVALLALTWFDRTLDRGLRRVLVALTALALACIIGYFVVQPMMAALREGAGAGGVMASSSRRQFGMLHGVSMLLYLIQSLLAAALVLKSRTQRRK